MALCCSRFFKKIPPQKESKQADVIEILPKKESKWGTVTFAVDYKCHQDKVYVLEMGRGFSSDYQGYSQAYPGKNLSHLILDNLLKHYRFVITIGCMSCLAYSGHKKVIYCSDSSDFLRKYDPTQHRRDNSVIIDFTSYDQQNKPMSRFLAWHKIDIPVSSSSDLLEVCFGAKALLYQFCEDMGEPSLLPKTVMMDRNAIELSAIDEFKSDFIIFKLPNSTKGQGACVFSKGEAKEFISLLKVNKGNEYKTTCPILKTKIEEFTASKSEVFVLQEVISSDVLLNGYDPSYRAVFNAYWEEEKSGEFKVNFEPIGDMHAEMPAEKRTSSVLSSANLVLSSRDDAPDAHPVSQTVKNNVIAQLTPFLTAVFRKAHGHSLCSYMTTLSHRTASTQYVRTISKRIFQDYMISFCRDPIYYLTADDVGILVSELDNLLLLLTSAQMDWRQQEKLTRDIYHILQLFFSLQMQYSRYQHYIPTLQSSLTIFPHNKSIQILKKMVDDCSRDNMDLMMSALTLCSEHNFSEYQKENLILQGLYIKIRQAEQTPFMSQLLKIINARGKDVFSTLLITVGEYKDNHPQDLLFWTQVEAVVASLPCASMPFHLLFKHNTVSRFINNHFSSAPEEKQIRDFVRTKKKAQLDVIWDLFNLIPQNMPITVFLFLSQQDMSVLNILLELFNLLKDLSADEFCEKILITLSENRNNKNRVSRIISELDEVRFQIEKENLHNVLNDYGVSRFPNSVQHTILSYYKPYRPNEMKELLTYLDVQMKTYRSIKHLLACCFNPQPDADEVRRFLENKSSEQLDTIWKLLNVLPSNLPPTIFSFLSERDMTVWQQLVGIFKGLHFAGELFVPILYTLLNNRESISSTLTDLEEIQKKAAIADSTVRNKLIDDLSKKLDVEILGPRVPSMLMRR